MRWSAMPVMLEEASSEIWAEDLFAPCSTKCWLSCSNDDITDSSGSEICDDEDDDDEEWSSSDSDEEMDGFSFGSDGDVDFWGDQWFWSPCHDDDELAVQSCSDMIVLGDVETSSYVAERLVDYVMPSMDLSSDVDSWIDKYGSSRSQVRFVNVPLSDPCAVDHSLAFVLPSTSRGLFVAVL
ncbi:unnamed protein product [Phytophthora lilii]|uniref:Unnamed protein product n=1 Tax=Phytophthora lilii TaxID=2077276 RepID=A0A9W6WPQ6_9STRA|nr:unnamed protein product [Phytophthora lilii]